jgi:hypothetical protein
VEIQHHHLFFWNIARQQKNTSSSLLRLARVVPELEDGI